ncbi:sulfotransferase 6B1-like isoform X1 [Oncorhynchus tshawytscha]|uniref:Sulfotransferase n=1 Tax=Oncorhynchus tshawytscha TaxID=74940 RepID=A0AAZ3QTJ8_ONCTS|nr:sulfotransferase 6B1-like isoform X1 [Oncorhynchus tshawytscha]
MSKPMSAQRISKMDEAKNVKDENKLYLHEGILYSTIMSPSENLKGLKELEGRPNDILLVAYPKCGFNWMVAVLRKIMAAASGQQELSQIPPLMEFLSPDMQKVVGEMPSPRLLGTHLHPDNIPGTFIAKKTKMLVVFRNPKDTVVSYYHFMNTNPVLPNAKSWDSFFTDFMEGEVAWGSYFNHALAWEKLMDNPNILMVTYEQMKENLGQGVQQISKFFDFPLTEEQVQTIARQSTFNAMKESSKNTHGKHGNVFFRKDKGAVYRFIHPSVSNSPSSRQTLLPAGYPTQTPSRLREVGDWKNHLSEAQSKQMDEKFEKHLAHTKLGAKLKYDIYCK